MHITSGYSRPQDNASATEGLSLCTLCVLQETLDNMGIKIPSQFQ